jgi:hypothetical protein
MDVDVGVLSKKYILFDVAVDGVREFCLFSLGVTEKFFGGRGEESRLVLGHVHHKYACMHL